MYKSVYILNDISKKLLAFLSAYHFINTIGGARGVVVISVGNEHGDTSSNHGQD